MQEACGWCYYWTKLESNGDVGNCRRHAPEALVAYDTVQTAGAPPQVAAAYVDVGVTMWPLTVRGDWCGDWRMEDPQRLSASYPHPGTCIAQGCPLARKEA